MPYHHYLSSILFADIGSYPQLCIMYEETLD